MNFLKSIFKKRENFVSTQAQNDCPNCWEKKEYSTAGRVKIFRKKRKKAFISQFMETYVTGVKSKQTHPVDIHPINMFV